MSHYSPLSCKIGDSEPLEQPNRRGILIPVAPNPQPAIPQPATKAGTEGNRRTSERGEE